MGARLQPLSSNPDAIVSLYQGCCLTSLLILSRQLWLTPYTADSVCFDKLAFSARPSRNDSLTVPHEGVICGLSQLEVRLTTIEVISLSWPKIAIKPCPLRNQGGDFNWKDLSYIQFSLCTKVDNRFKRNNRWFSCLWGALRANKERQNNRESLEKQNALHALS